MNIKILYGVSGAREAEGTAVIVDIFRASTVAAFALFGGVKYIIPVLTKEEAFDLKKNEENCLLVGEEGGYIIENFDYGNSPSDMAHACLKDKVIIHRTTNGTRGIVNAVNSQEIIFGSFPVISSIKNYILKTSPSAVSLVSMDGPGSEDDIFCKCLYDMICSNDINIESIIGEVKKAINKPYEYPPEDLPLCLKVDIFDFIPVIKLLNNRAILVKQSLKC